MNDANYIFNYKHVVTLILFKLSFDFQIICKNSFTKYLFVISNIY